MEVSETLFDPLVIADGDLLLPDNSVPKMQNLFSRKVDIFNFGTYLDVVLFSNLSSPEKEKAVSLGKLCFWDYCDINNHCNNYLADILILTTSVPENEIYTISTHVPETGKLAHQLTKPTSNARRRKMSPPALLYVCDQL